MFWNKQANLMGVVVVLESNSVSACSAWHKHGAVTSSASTDRQNKPYRREKYRGWKSVQDTFHQFFHSSHAKPCLYAIRATVMLKQVLNRSSIKAELEGELWR